MIFSCILATRGNPERAAAVIEIARALASGENTLRFVVCCDWDDKPTQNKFRYEYQCGDTTMSCGDSPLALGNIWNRGAGYLDGGDVICPLGDDTFIASPDWDAQIAFIFNKMQPSQRVLGWDDLANPGLCTLPIVGRDWYNAAGLYPGWFPYWFYDTWLAEVYSFTHGFAPGIPNGYGGLTLAAKKGKTQRMRDLGFWWDFFTKTRPVRVKEGQRLQAHFGLNTLQVNVNTMVEYWNYRDASFLKSIPQMELDMADVNSRVPSDRYLLAKRNAEEYLATGCGTL